MIDIFVDQPPDLRRHQDEALISNNDWTGINAVINKGHGKGKIILPTGTGKTRIEIETVCAIINRQKKKKLWPGVHVILSPRILLAYQQLAEFTDTITRKGDGYKDFKWHVVNSGGLNSAQYEKMLMSLGVDSPDEIDSSTDRDTIKINMLEAKKANVPLVIFTTYHSAWNVDKAATEIGIKIESYICDEAQYCVTSGKFQDIPDFDCNYKFYFTATEKDTDSPNGLGMNNEQKFGKVLFTESPRTLIERGEMSSVAIHLVGTKGQIIDDNDYESKAKVVIDAFEKHRIVLKAHSSSPDSIGPKMVVVCDKQDSLRGVLGSKILKAYRTEYPKITLCALSSEYGLEINGKHDPRVNNRNKEKLLKTLMDLKSEAEAIIFHVDMISEGINVPGLTAVMPFRNLGKIKFLQNLGRGTRLIPEDRRRLYSGRIEPIIMGTDNWKKYVKPFCWLILPVLSIEYYDMKRRYSDYICALRADYGFNSSELIVIDNIVAPHEDKPLDDMAGDKKRKFSYGAGLIKDIIHEIEDGEKMAELLNHTLSFKTLTPDMQIKLLNDIYENSEK